MTTEKNEPFKIGIALSGAATGGAFSAGVMDFLLEAMNELQAAKEKNPSSLPPWTVSLTDIVGTSAGGITGTLAVAALNTSFTPLPKDFKYGDDAPDHNPLYATWVSEMDHSNLLVMDDLNPDAEGKRKVVSFLNADFMDKTANKVLADYGSLSELPEFATDLLLSLTSTNMRGIPYSVPDFKTADGGVQKFVVSQFADFTSYYLHEEEVPADHWARKNAILLDAKSDRTTPDWKMAVRSTRATAAFPGGFPTVSQTKSKEGYNSRFSVKPSWPESLGPDGDISYSSVDGGLVNNDPFDIVYNQMSQRHNKGTLSADNSSTWGSIILIDPFPQGFVDNEAIEDNIPVAKMLPLMFGAIRGQAMFKSRAVNLEWRSSHDKYLIQPLRDVGPGQKYFLGTATLGAFGGIIDEKIRLHDYMLGRHNCQQFLRDGLFLTHEEVEKNPLFASFDGIEDMEKIPIIPLVGTAQDECPLPEWPSYSEKESKRIIDVNYNLMHDRLKEILNIYMENSNIIEKAKWYDVIQKTRNGIANTVRDRLLAFLGREILASLGDALSAFSK